MASYSKPRIYVWKADGAVSQGMVLKAGSDDDHVAKATAVTDKFVGIAGGATVNAEDKIEVMLPGGGALGLAGGTIAFGDPLTVDANGKLVASVTDKDRLIGKAMHAAVAGDLFAMEVFDGFMSV